MGFPYVEVFLGLLLGYMVYSVWADLDARFPIGAALVLLVATAVVDALGATDSANTLAEFVFFLLGAGVVLLLIEHVREGRRAESTGTASAVAESPSAQSERATDRPADASAGSSRSRSLSRAETSVRDDDYHELPPDTEPVEGDGDARQEWMEDPDESDKGPGGKNGPDDAYGEGARLPDTPTEG